MAIGEQLQGITGNIFGSIFNVTIMAVLGLIVLGMVGALMYYFFIYKKKFDIQVKIISDRANEPHIVFDKAGILYDRKNKTNYFKLWKLKKELETPPFNILQKTNKGDFIELYRTGENQFVFLTRPKIDKEWIVKANGKKFPMAKMIHKQIESDFYWQLKRSQEDKSWISPDSFLSKIIQMLPILIPGVLMIVIFLFFLNALPEILNSLSAVIDKLNTLEGVANRV